MSEAPVHRVGDALAAVLLLSDLARLLNVSAEWAWKLEREGAFDAFELVPRIGKRRRYSGKKVQAWLDGQTTDAPASRYFGRKRL
jgi:hypothetical protein